MKCKYCNPSKEFEKWQIRKFKYWTIYLSTNQCYLGRCVVKLNRHLEDFFSINKQERAEFFKIVKELRDVIRLLFGAELFNYAFLGNVVRHLHLHFIPRYSKEVGIGWGYIFRDERWGKNYTPYDYEFKTPKDALFLIRDKIKKRIDKLEI